MNDLFDMRALAPEGIARDGEGWIRNVLQRSALDFHCTAALLRQAPGGVRGSDCGAEKVGKGPMARVDLKGRK